MTRIPILCYLTQLPIHFILTLNSQTIAQLYLESSELNIFESWGNFEDAPDYLTYKTLLKYNLYCFILLFLNRPSSYIEQICVLRP